MKNALREQTGNKDLDVEKGKNDGEFDVYEWRTTKENGKTVDKRHLVGRVANGKYTPVTAEEIAAMNAAKVDTASASVIVDQKVLDVLPEGMLADIDAIHKAPARPDKYKIRVKPGKKTQSVGGYFTPGEPPGPKPRRKKGESYVDYQNRYQAWKSQPWEPTIVINEKSKNAQDSAINTYLHEFGHSMDWHSGNKVGQIAWRSSVTGLDGSPEMLDLISTIRDHPEFIDKQKQLKTGFGPSGAKHAKYARDRREIWARSYAQYMQMKLGGDYRTAFDTQMEAGTSFKYDNFTWEVFETEIAPKVEAVLQGMGLM